MRQSSIAIVGSALAGVLTFACQKPAATARGTAMTTEISTTVSRTTEFALPSGKSFSVMVIMDESAEWSEAIREGFRSRLNALATEAGSAVEYRERVTAMEMATATAIRNEIERDKPDLACTIVYPSGFADIEITQKLKGNAYRFVSVNCVPVESGTIEYWEKPGGNVTGVGVFVQMNSVLRLIRLIKPSIDKLYFYSWETMTFANDWFRKELTRAVVEEGLELAEFKLIPNIEAEAAYLDRFLEPRDDAAIMVGISAWVHADGTPANVDTELAPYFQSRLAVPQLGYEDAPVKFGIPLATGVIWFDIGAQMAEKAARILSGENPGDIPWSYPRKFNILINKKSADRLGLTIPEDILTAAYRIYTDYDGNFIGKAD